MNTLDMKFQDRAAVTWYIAAALPRMRQMTPADIQAISEACSTLADADPLHLVPGERYQVHGWQSAAKLTGRQVVALLITALWLLCGEDRDKAAPLLSTFPSLADALFLV